MSNLNILMAAAGAAAMVISAIWYYFRRQNLSTQVNETLAAPDKRTILKLVVPKVNNVTPLNAEQLFATLHSMSLNKQKSVDHFSLEIIAGEYGIHFIVVINQEYKTFFQNQIYAQYPEAQIIEIDDYTNSLYGHEGVIQMTRIQLEKDYFLPIRTFSSFDVDPLTDITKAIGNLSSDQEVYIQILARPIADYWQEKGIKYVSTVSNKEIANIIKVKNEKPGFQVAIRVLAKTKNNADGQRLLNEAAAAFDQFRATNFNGLSATKKPTGLKAWRDAIKLKFQQSLLGRRAGQKLTPVQKYSWRFLDEFTTDIINTEEIASLYHLPSSSVDNPNISWAKTRKLEFPLNIPQHESRIIGETDYRGEHIKFGIRPLDRLRHIYIIGKTGVGKSTFMLGSILADIYDGKGVGVIDPHGDMINDILEKIPAHRLNDVVLFDPKDKEYSVGLNLLQIDEDEDKSLVANGIASAFKKELGDSWGQRLEYIFTNAILTLLHCQNISILVLPQLLSDTNYRKSLLKQVKDPVLLKFWQEEYNIKNSKTQIDEITPILNKIESFTKDPIIRNIVGQVNSNFKLKDVIDNKKILLVNLAQSKIGAENMSLLGRILVTRIYTNAKRRISLPKDQRTPFYLYVDEFQNISTPTFVKIFSEARKFGLSLNIAHQFTYQIEDAVLNAILDNVGTIITFRLDPKDAELFAKKFSPYVQPEDFMNLGRGEIILKMSIDFSQSKPFTARTLFSNFPNTKLSLKDRKLKL